MDALRQASDETPSPVTLPQVHLPLVTSPPFCGALNTLPASSLYAAPLRYGDWDALYVATAECTQRMASRLSLGGRCFAILMLTLTCAPT